MITAKQAHDIATKVQESLQGGIMDIIYKVIESEAKVGGQRTVVAANNYTMPVMMKELENKGFKVSITNTIDRTVLNSKTEERIYELTISW